jgi:hypothetical protein
VVNDYSGDNYGMYTSLDIDGNGNQSIAYFNYTDLSLMWAHWSSNLHRWIFETVASGDQGEYWGRNVSHQWYGTSKCGFAFQVADGSNWYLEFVRWTANGWEYYVADTYYDDASARCSFAWIKSGPNAGDGWISHGNDLGLSASLRYTYVNE